MIRSWQAHIAQTKHIWPHSTATEIKKNSIRLKHCTCSRSFHSRKQWRYWSSRNISRFFSVLIHELVRQRKLKTWPWKRNDICSTKSGFRVLRFVGRSLFLISNRSSQFFSCPSAVLSSHNLRHESTSRLKQDAEGHYNYSKKFKQPKKCRLDQGRNRRALGSKGTKERTTKALIGKKERKNLEWNLRQV